MEELLFSSFCGRLNALQIFVRAIAAVMVGIVIGWEREKKNRPAGLRTHVLVCLAACVVAILENEIIYQVSVLGNDAIGVSVGRLSVGVLSGVGFLGAGTIMMNENKITGLTTAASLWCVAAFGLACGMGHVILAIAGAFLVIFILLSLQRFEQKSGSRQVRIKFINHGNVDERIKQIFSNKKFVVLKEKLNSEKINEEIIFDKTYLVIMSDNTNIETLTNELYEIQEIKEIRL